MMINRFFMCIKKKFVTIAIQTIVFLFLLFFLPTKQIFAKETDISKELERRLQEILDERTRDFFHEMIVKEQHLNFLVHSLNKEIKLRKDEGSTLDDSEFNLIFGVDESMVKKYENELSKIIGLIDDLNSLEKTSQSLKDNASTVRIAQLESRLKTILNVTDVGELDKYSEKLIYKLLSEYNDELDKLLVIVRELQKLKVKGQYLPQFQSQVTNLEKTIKGALDLTQKEDPLFDSYISEVIKVVDILRQLDELDQVTAGDSYDIHDQIRQVKYNVLRVVDPEALASLGYGEVAFAVEEKRLGSYFDEWKARQVLWYRAQIKQAELMKTRLISSGSSEQNRRMFENDVLQAVHEFNEGCFDLACFLFDDILKYYSYKIMDDFRYYLAECFLMQKQYANAQELYIQIIENNAEKEFIKKSYWRLMLISDTFNRFNDFFDYADKALKLYHSETSDEFLEQVVFYAGYMAYQIRDFNRSINILNNISMKTPFFMPAQYLIAVNYININKSEKAQPILTILGKETSYRKKDDMSKALQNQALLKIGLIYYNDNDFVNAINTLQKVDPETPGFDVTLLARAWTWFRLGNMQEAANQLDLLLWNNLSSTYVYEAMMLSAHCNRLMGNVKSSIRKVRYVENAEKTKQINNEMNLERQRINTLLSQIDQLEEPVVLAGDVYAFQKLTELRRDLELSLQSMAYQGDPGFQLIQEYEDEHHRLEKLINDFQDLYEISDMLGRKKLKKEIRKIIPNLENKLLDVQKFQTIRRVDILADYPLAQKESNLQFQKQKLNKMHVEAEYEQKKLEFYKEEVASLLEKAEKSQNSEALSELNYRELEMEELKDRLEVFMVFLAESDVKMLETNFRKWSDFSGFGMSDLDFARMKNIEKRIQKNNDHINLINSVLRKQEKEILRELAIMDEKISELEKSMFIKEIESIKAERNRYFEEDYFLNQTSEIVRDPDQDLKILLEEQQKNQEKINEAKNREK